MVPAVGPSSGHRGWGVRVLQGDNTLQEGAKSSLRPQAPLGELLPLNAMPIICPSSFLDGSPLLHPTGFRCGKPSWPWWPHAGWLDPGEGLHTGEMGLRYEAESSKGLWVTQGGAGRRSAHPG